MKRVLWTPVVGIALDLREPNKTCREDATFLLGLVYKGLIPASSHPASQIFSRLGLTSDFSGLILWAVVVRIGECERQSSRGELRIERAA